MKTIQRPVSNGIVQAYERDGYYVAHHLLSPKECEELKAEATRVLRECGKPGTTVYVSVAAVNARYYRLADDPRVVSILQAIMPKGVMFLSDKFVFKTGAKKFATPWHIDAFYWRNTRPKLSVWIALDDVSAVNGALKVIPRSHLREWKPHVENDMGNTNGEFAHVISDTPWKPEDEVICEIRKGGAIFFSDRLVHGSCTNLSGQDRYAIISTYHAPQEDEEFDKHFPARHVIVPQPGT